MVAGGPTEEDGWRAAEQLLGAAELPTALVAFNDHCAFGVLGRLVARRASAYPARCRSPGTTTRRSRGTPPST